MQNLFKYAIVFAGQGAQKPGMGKSLYETSPAARAVFDRAGDEIKRDCFEEADRTALDDSGEGTTVFSAEEWLKRTEVTQPAVYTMDMAAYAALREALGARGCFEVGAGAGANAGTGAGGFPEPSGVAGFSLGEYAALTAAGVIDSLETGLALVRKRSLLMKAAGTNPDGSRRGTMAAGMGAVDAVLALVEKARGGDVLEAVNFNSPQQTVVAGDAAAVERFADLAKEDRSLGVKAIPLAVSGAFHSPIMRPAAEGLAEALKDYSFNVPTLSVYLNATGETYESFGMGEAAAKARAVMARQIQSPVYWQKTIEAMAGAGIEMIIEVGPGKTLSGLVRKTAPGITTLHVEDAESLAETVKHIKESVCAAGRNGKE